MVTTHFKLCSSIRQHRLFTLIRTSGVIVLMIDHCTVVIIIFKTMLFRYFSFILGFFISDDGASATPPPKHKKRPFRGPAVIIKLVYPLKAL